MNLRDAAQEITRYVDNVTSMGALTRFLRDHFREALSILIVGGALRDLLLTPRRTPKDIDVVLEGIDPRDVYEFPGAYKNFFGGITLTYGDFSIDMWRLEDTYHLKEFPLPSSVSGFLQGAPFNIDKIAYDLLTGELHDDGCLAGICQRELRYAPAWPYLEPIQATRAILLRRKINFRFHESVEQLLERSAFLIQRDPTEVASIKDYLRYLKKFLKEESVDLVLGEIRKYSK